MNWNEMNNAKMAKGNQRLLNLGVIELHAAEFRGSGGARFPSDFEVVRRRLGNMKRALEVELSFRRKVIRRIFGRFQRIRLA